ncbi:MAG: PAS domain-containing protein [Chloroflexi bacterium]|nr:PAS domain-containing protein [Chloroflexota bacterium]
MRPQSIQEMPSQKNTHLDIEDIHDASERFFLAVQGANDGLWDWNIAAHEVYFSPRWKEMLGYKDEEIPNRVEELIKRIHLDDLKYVMAELQQYLDGQAANFRLEYRLQHKDGTYRWMLAHGALLRDASGKPCRLSGWHTDITEHKRAEEELEERVRERTKELSLLYERAQALAVVRERQRLARELHDSVSQALYSISLCAHSAREELKSDPSQAIAPIEHVSRFAEMGLAEMQTLLFDLRPESLETEGLVAALMKQVVVLRTCYNLTVEVSLSSEPAISVEKKHALYCIAREALHNIVKHARARMVRLLLANEQRQVILEVKDDGRGFDPTGIFSGHLGLRSMQERTARLDGIFSLESTPGRGTVVYACIPAYEGEEGK